MKFATEWLKKVLTPSFINFKGWVISTSTCAKLTGMKNAQFIAPSGVFGHHYYTC